MTSTHTCPLKEAGAIAFVAAMSHDMKKKDRQEATSRLKVLSQCTPECAWAYLQWDGTWHCTMSDWTPHVKEAGE